MKTLFKTTIVILLMIIAVNNEVKAQEPQKYDFAIIQFNQYGTKKPNMSVSINGEQFEEILAIEQKGWGDLSAPLKKINEMQDKGWELYSEGAMGTTNDRDYIFYMRKKKSATTK
jgi:hypothetical protein